MVEIGIRALKQNASAVVARVAAGETVTITDRGRPVARMTPISTSSLEEMRAAGLVRPATRSLKDLPSPEPLDDVGPSMAEILDELREDRI
jgi:prevent-host-death family protein